MGDAGVEVEIVDSEQVRSRRCLIMCASDLIVRERPCHLPKNISIFPLVGFKGNLSPLDICLSFPGGVRKCKNW